MTTFKILLNKAITERAKTKRKNLLTADIKDFFLNTVMETPEYFTERVENIPPNIIEEYNMAPLIYKDHKRQSRVMFEVNKGLYGLPQASLLAHLQMNKHLAQIGYHECIETPCLYTNTQNRLAFTLVVDDFCVYYEDTEEVDKLLEHIEKAYVITRDWECESYLGMRIQFSQDHDEVAISIPDYVQRAVKRFMGNELPVHQLSPLKYEQVNWFTTKLPAQLDLGPKIGADEILWLQQLIGTFLYYARAVDPTILVAINKLAVQQTTATTHTILAAKHLLGYLAAHPNAKIIYRPSNMQLVGQSDASYLSEQKSRSRWGYLLYFELLAPRHPHDINGTIECMSVITDVVVGSACEAEYGGTYKLAQHAIPLLRTAEDFGYKQGICNLITDNEASMKIATGTVARKLSKAFDMRFHWIQDRIARQQFKMTWWSTEWIQADFLTKVFHPSEFQKKKKEFVTDGADAPASGEGVLL
jgi:hypothetical protein